MGGHLCLGVEQYWQGGVSENEKALLVFFFHILENSSPTQITDKQAERETGEREEE